MMKKFLLALLAMAWLLLPAAQAEEAAPYVPGSVTHTLFSEAYDRGDMILMDMYYSLTLGENSAALFGEDAALLAAVSEALPNAALSVGAGKLEDGVRLLLAGQYAADAQQAGLDLLLDLTRDGMSIMSSAIPGERFTARWETLLALCGMSEEEIAQILSLRDMDLHATLDVLAEQLTAALGLIGQIAAPYGETILAHIAALPKEIRTDVPAEGGFPAAATEVCLLITQKAMGDLFTALASQLEADATLCALLDAALAQSGEALTTAQLCQAMKTSAAESWTDETTPLHVYIGMDEAENFLYVNATSHVQDAPAFTLITMPYENTGLSLLSIDYLTLNAEGNPNDGFSFAALYPQAQTDGDFLELQLYLEMFEQGEPLLVTEFAISEGGVTTEDNLPGRSASCAMALGASDGDELVSMMITAGSVQNATAEGGEESALAGSMEIAYGEAAIPASFEAYARTEQSESGPVSSISTFFCAPMLGLNEYVESYTLYTASYAPDLSSVSEVALETATAEELEALAGRAASSIEATLNTLMNLLPQTLVEQIAG